MRCSSFFLALAVAAASGCGRPAARPCPPVLPASLPAAPVAAPPEQPRATEELAVMPIEDSRLFRHERAQLRALVAGRLAQIATDFRLAPLAEVDLGLLPVAADGARCAYEHTAKDDRARRQGWRYTQLYQVAGAPGESGEELWVRVLGGNGPLATFVGPWDARVDRLNRYAQAIALLRPAGDRGLLGGIGGRGNRTHAHTVGPVTFCESSADGFLGSCAARSSSWDDIGAAAATCFEGADEGREELLVEAGAPGRCELTNVDDLGGRDGARERCLCPLVLGSSGLAGEPGRRHLRVHFEALDLAGRARPEVRLIDATTNVPLDDGWHHPPGERRTPVRRLEMDNLDGFAAPLARCALPAGTHVVVQASITPRGAVSEVRLLSSLAAPQEKCVRAAVARGALSCTTDGQPATVRLALVWEAP